MKYDELTKRLKEYAEWAYGNEWEVPICMGSDLRDAATYISDLSVENQALRNSANRFKAECAELRDQIIDLETQHRTEMCEDGYDCVELGRARTENTKLRAELDKETRSRKKQAEIINELRATKYEQIEVINKLKTELEELNNCRHKCKIIRLLKEYQKVSTELGQVKQERDSYKHFFDDITSKPDCNTCCDLTCRYRPKVGKTTRFNCPLWHGKEETTCK